MKIHLLLAFLLVAWTSSQAQKYRWDAKILVDSVGPRIYKMRAKPESIEKLADRTSTPRPDTSQMKNNKRADSEKRKVTLTAFVTADGREDDGDYHLVLKSVTGDKTLIAEIPNPDIPKLKDFPGLVHDFTVGRSFVDEKIGKPPGEVTDLHEPVKVKITGVVFFDKIAHGNGHAENGVEIHPVLRIKKVK